MENITDREERPARGSVPGARRPLCGRCPLSGRREAARHRLRFRRVRSARLLCGHFRSSAPHRYEPCRSSGGDSVFRQQKEKRERTSILTIR
ncbi:hypothetical protein [Lachnoclostridium sp. Marseille-P6806]|uniref:hypothetical protein n=1 Tax=Lachnoclostridium sp. Marseille-P6806 TaxID=2364793 RepID=UPI003FA5C708